MELIKYRKQECRSAKESESPADLFRPLAGVLGWPHATTSSRAAFQSFSIFVRKLALTARRLSKISQVQQIKKSPVHQTNET